MKRFKYKVKTFGAHKMSLFRMDDYLNEEGADGWELTQIIVNKMLDNPDEDANYIFVFKKEEKP